MGEFEALGDAVTGGLLARAVEPRAGEAVDDGHTHEKNCLNCGTPLKGSYCHTCGQKAHVHRSVRSFLLDFIQNLFNFEGKIWRTVPMLAWRPGELTRRYIAGERARFVSPVALYLFTVFLAFAVLNFSGALGGHPPKSIKTNLVTAVNEQQAKIAKLESQRAAALAAGKSVADLDEKLADEKEGLAAIQQLKDGDLHVKGNVDSGTPEWVRDAIQKTQQNPELVAARVQDAASKYSWVLIPLSVPFLWLLFPFSRRYHLYDHMVFVTYSLSFMMMLVIIGSLLTMFRFSSLAGLLFFVPPFHMYRQLKGAYQLGRFATWWRTILLVTFAFIAAGLFFAFVTAVGMA